MRYRGGIYGEVYLWGRVVEHPAGWRAQFAYPKTLKLPIGFGGATWRRSWPMALTSTSSPKEKRLSCGLNRWAIPNLERGCYHLLPPNLIGLAAASYSALIWAAQAAEESFDRTGNTIRAGVRFTPPSSQGNSAKWQSDVGPAAPWFRRIDWCLTGLPGQSAETSGTSAGRFRLAANRRAIKEGNPRGR